MADTKAFVNVGSALGWRYCGFIKGRGIYYCIYEDGQGHYIYEDGQGHRTFIDSPSATLPGPDSPLSDLRATPAGPGTPGRGRCR